MKYYYIALRCYSDDVADQCGVQGRTAISIAGCVTDLERSRAEILFRSLSRFRENLSSEESQMFVQ
jgi:hypothetical protein